MSLNQADIISAIFSLILIIIYIVIGLTISLKYFKTKQRTFLLMGMAWMLLSMIWWSSVINIFILILFPTSIGLTGQFYYIIASGLLPVCFLLFITAITDLTLNKFQLYFQVLLVILGAIFYVVSFYFLFIDPEIIIIKREPIKVVNSWFYIFFILIYIMITEIVGISFAIQSIKSEKRLIRIKGILILIALILLPIGGFIDAIETSNLLEFTDRIILIISVTIFYFGFVMPEWLKTRIIENR